MPKLSKARPTLGLEIEFLVPYKIDGSIQAATLKEGLVRVPVGNGSEIDQDADARMYIYESLRQSIIASGNKAGTVGPWGASPGITTELWSESWIVKRDASVYETNLGEFNGFVDVELNSPIYNAPPDNDKSAQKWKRVTRTMRRIQEDFPQIHINNNCAYQVHVGYPTGYDVLDIKKLATILWLSEPRLLGLYKPDRQQDCWWYRQLSKHSRLAIASPIEQFIHHPQDKNRFEMFNWKLQADVTAGNYRTGTKLDDYETWIGSGAFGDRVIDCHKTKTPQWSSIASSSTQPSGAQENVSEKPRLEDKMADLWKAEDGQQLCSMLSPRPSGGQATRLAYNFNNVFGIKGTVEFRQMESTLDPVHLRNWAIVCYKLVIFARESSVQEFQNMLQCLLKDPSQYDIWALLGDIKCQEDVIEWFKKKNADMR